MIDEDRDLSVLVVPAAGAVEAGNDLWEPVRLIGSDGEPVVAVMAFLRELPGLVIDLDASIVVCHSEKEHAAPTFSR
jgi:hypothetical protein